MFLSACSSRAAKTSAVVDSAQDVASSSYIDPELGEPRLNPLQTPSGEAAVGETPIDGASDHEAPESSDTGVAPENAWALILVNASNPIDPDYEPELEYVQNEYRMDVRVAPIMRQMIDDARTQGVELLVCSAYRPYTSQERNFNAKVSEYQAMGYGIDDARAATLRLIAAPGASEHHTGLAADIVTPSYQGLDDGYANTAAAKWLLENAPGYGFILRYPKDKTDVTGINFEPWHYRYVGVDAAKKIMDAGLCLEEYV